MPSLRAIHLKFRDKLEKPETRLIVLSVTEDRTMRIFIRLDKTPERDGWTERQTDGQTDLPWLLQRRASHCKQCERAVKTTAFDRLRGYRPHSPINPPPAYARVCNG